MLALLSSPTGMLSCVSSGSGASLVISIVVELAVRNWSVIVLEVVAGDTLPDGNQEVISGLKPGEKVIVTIERG